MANGTQQKSGFPMILKIVGGGCLVLIVFMVGFGVFVYMNARQLGATIARQVIVSAIDDIGLPEDQEAALIAEVDQLTDDFKEGIIELEDLAKVGEEIGESPLIYVGMLMASERELLDTEELADNVKEEARLHFGRFARGAIEGKIRLGEVESIIQPYRNYGFNTGNQQLKSDLTLEERLEFIEAVKSQADEAEIPMEPYEVDYAQLFSDLVDRALGRTPAPEPLEAPAEAPPPAEVPEPVQP